MTPDVLAVVDVVNAAASGHEIERKSTLGVLLDMSRRQQQKVHDFDKSQPCIEAVRKWSPTNMAVSVSFISHVAVQCAIGLVKGVFFWKRQGAHAH